MIVPEFMSLKHIKRITHKSFAGFMAIWLSGVIFLLCCEPINGRAAEKESCPLAKMSADCDNDKPANLSASVTSHGGELCFDCCGFLPAVFDKARKVETAQKHFAATPEAAAVKFIRTQPVDHTPTFTAVQTRVPDRHGTFIKNCVFRI